MKIVNFIASVLLLPTLLFSQSAKVGLLSGGGGAVSNGTYTNIGAIGQFAATKNLGNSFQNAEGFLYASENPKPTVPASALRFSNIARTSLTLSWNGGDGTKRVVLVKNNKFGKYPLTNGTPCICHSASFSDPLNTMVDNGAVCVYNGTGTSVDITGLTKYKLYYFRVIEYAYEDEPSYLQTITSDNPASRWTLRREFASDDAIVESPISIYPNPTNGLANIELESNEMQNAQAELYSSDGALVKTIELGMFSRGTNTISLNLSEQSSGVYLIKINLGNESLIGIIEVQK
jgi:hypothetical protein